MTTSMTTNRLFLSQLEQSDSHFILELVNTKGWIDFIGDKNMRTLHESVQYIQKIQADPNIHYWVVRLKTDQQPVGIVSLVKRSYLTAHDIGFAFLPAFTNKGYAFEATAELLDNLNLPGGNAEVLAVTKSNNSGAIKLLNRLGLKFKEKITNENEMLEIYSISARDLKRRKLNKQLQSNFPNKNN